MPVPKGRKAVVYQVLRFGGVVDETPGIGQQPGLVVDIQFFEIGPYGFAVHLSGRFLFFAVWAAFRPKCNGKYNKK